MQLFIRHLKIKLLILLLLTVATNSTIAANPKITLKKLQDGSLSIGLALSGGAAKGLAHIGVIKALEESGIKVDYIAGSSMGALVGAAYASGIPIDTLEKIAINTDWVTVAKLFVPGFSTAGLVEGKRVKEFLSSIYGDVRIEDCPIPFAATAADISTGKLYIINRGSLLEAVRASISIPIVFTPVKYQDILLVDGGVVDPVPIDIVKEMGADYIIAVHVIHGSLASEKGKYIQIENPEPQTSATWKSTNEWLTKQLKMDTNKGKEPKKAPIETDNNSKSLGMGRISENTLYIAQDVIARLQIELYKPDLVIEPDTRNINLYEFYRGKDVIEIGYNEAKKVLMNLPN